jgi:flagellar motor component MotA
MFKLRMKLLETIHCSKEEKKQLLNEIFVLSLLSEKARKEGMLRLCDDLPFLADDFLRFGLQTAVDDLVGSDKIFRELLYSAIMTMNLDGKKLLKRIIQAEGVLMIYQGFNVRLLKENLLSLLGEDFMGVKFDAV